MILTQYTSHVMVELYLPRDLVRNMEKKIVIADVPSSLCHFWEFRQHEHIETIHKEYSVEEKRQCISDIEGFMVTIRHQAREHIFLMILQRLTHHQVVREDKQEFHQWKKAKTKNSEQLGRGRG